jgi:Family of unknown function (DUF5850)
MFDTKFIVTLTALVVAVIAICNFDNKKVTSSEGYMGLVPGGQIKTVLEAAPNKLAAARGQFTSLPGFGVNTASMAALNGDTSGLYKGDFFSVPGTFQAAISPRFANTNFGANITYNRPAMKNMAAPCDPLMYGKMAKENFTTKEDYGCGTCNNGLSCAKGGEPGAFHGGAPLMDSDYTAGNYQSVMDSARGSNESSYGVNMLPVDTMATVDADGEVVQPLMYTRFMVANRNSRLRSQGDMIRGDLAIVPCNTGWFQVSVAPNIDLQQGAMNVLAGETNEVTQALSQLMFASSGDTTTTIAGANLETMRNVGNVNQSAMFQVGLNQAQSTVNVTAFP